PRASPRGHAAQSGVTLGPEQGELGDGFQLSWRREIVALFKRFIVLCTKPWLGSRNQVSKREQLLNTDNPVSTMSSERLATPPPQLQDGNSGAKSPLTPEQTRRME